MTISVDPTTVAGCVAAVLAVPEASKGIRKLFETTADQIGLYFQPSHTRRIAEANADAREIEERNKVAVQVIRAEGKLVIKDIHERAVERVRSTQERRQRNIEQIVEKAADEVPDADVDVSDTPVDPDWTARFFEKCQGVSDEQMQRLWARVLAGETAQPGSFSRKTLAVVDVMTMQNADLFTRLCSTTWYIVDSVEILIYSPNPVSSRLSGGLSFEDFVNLDSLGLVRFDHDSGFTISTSIAGVKSDDAGIPLNCFGEAYSLSYDLPDRNGLAMPAGIAILTEAGRELSIIAGGRRSDDYRDAVFDHLRTNGWTIKPRS